MRIEMTRDGRTYWAKEQDVQRFLDRGWQTAQPTTKKISKPKVKVEAVADVVKAEEIDWEAPIITMPEEDLPTQNQ